MSVEWTFRLFPDLPHPPEELVARIDRLSRPGDAKFSRTAADYLGIQEREDWKRQRYEWIQPMASNRNKRQRFDPEFTAWIRRNVTDTFQADNSGVMFFDEPQLPHTDLTRDFVLLYNLEAGGEESELCFWREAGQPLYRERMLAVERGPSLQLVDRVRGPFRCWYLMNTRILHSVENVSRLRLNLQVSFDVDLPRAFLSQP
jgi:hypothetical protein